MTFYKPSELTVEELTDFVSVEATRQSSKVRSHTRTSRRGRRYNVREHARSIEKRQGMLPYGRNWEERFRKVHEGSILSRLEKYAKTKKLKLEVDDSDEESLEKGWQSLAEGKVTEAEFIDAFSEAFSGLEGVKEFSFSGYDGYLSIAFQVRDSEYDEYSEYEYSESLVILQRWFRKERSGIHVHHSYASIDRNLQGQGLIKQQWLKAIPMYQKMGVRRITCDANIDVGAYAWAKYGYLPETDRSWRYLVNNIRSRLQSRYKDQLGPEMYKAVSKILSGKSRYNLWKIADLRTPISDSWGETLPLGKALLMNMSWSAELDLKNDRQTKRMNAYLKGK